MVARAKDFRNIEKCGALVNVDEAVAAGKVGDGHFDIRDQRDIVDKVLQAVMPSVDLGLLSVNNVRNKICERMS